MKQTVTMLDIAILLADLKTGDAVEIDGTMRKLVDAYTEGSAAVLLKSLIGGSKVTIDGRDHRLVDAGGLRDMEDDVRFLGALHAEGVDNWTGYDDARSRAHEDRGAERHGE